MTKRLNFILAVHNHQPVGNLDSVFMEACDRAYEPLLGLLDEFPQIQLVLHYSGSLLEWAEANRPQMLDHIQRLHGDGRIELMGGGFYEPIFSMLPERDRRGQIELCAEYLGARFGAAPRGAWLAERVWEQNVVHSLADSGIEYTVVDDWHFKQAGLREDALTGCFLTEDEGRLLRVFPASERLRYLIPFGTVDETLGYLESLANEASDSTVVYADDGEKFGIWPGTHTHVYENGWLRDFFAALCEAGSWLRLTTFSAAIEEHPPVGKIYLPDSAYREMGEWALPAQRQVEFEDFAKRVEGASGLESPSSFLRGGFWRNFKVRYPESNLMYARMLEVSDRVNVLQHDGPTRPKARRELYRGQCNCAYWHGVFGGLYLPHLRSAVYGHLLAAENLADAAETESARPTFATVRDFDLDGADEIRLASEKLVAYFKPTAGGRMYELDVRKKCFNVLATLSRRHEAYHHAILRREGNESVDGPTDGQAEAGQHGDIEHSLRYDWYDRASLIDHFFAPDVEVQHVADCRYGEDGDFVDQPYSVEVAPEAAALRMTRAGHVWVQHECQPFGIEKTVQFTQHGEQMDIRYAVRNLGPKPADVRFGVELNFAMLAGHAHDRYYVDGEGRDLGLLDSILSLPERSAIGITDEWLGLTVRADVCPDARIWTFPVQTVSQSQDGLELLYQSSVVLPVWRLALEPDLAADISIRLGFVTNGTAD